MIDKGVDYEFIKKQENPGLRHGIRHKSPEGGTDTIGYGHKLTPEESKSGEVYGIKIKDMTPEDAEVVLRKDVQRHAAKAAKKQRTQQPNNEVAHADASILDCRESP